MDLSTSYLGLRLSDPIMPGASPLADDLGNVRRLEDAGAPAIVMRSLFEEQIPRESLGAARHILAQGEGPPGAVAYFPDPREYVMPPDRYLEHLRRVKAAVAVPVIGSLNGTTARGWLEYARLIQEGGADALELNFYHLATDPGEDGAQVERRLLEIVRAVKQIVRIPVAVKLLPFFSSLSNLAHALDDAGADGLVLFNRFYQPDIDPEMLQATPHLHLSTSEDLLLRLRWLAILSGQVKASLAATGGVHTSVDVVKATLAGAHAVQVVAALIQHGLKYLAVLRRDLAHWLERGEYETLREAQGTMSLVRCPDPEAFERGYYVRALQRWRL